MARVFAISTKGSRCYTEAAYQDNDALLFGQQPGQKVQGIDLRIAPIGRQVLGALNGFLGFDGEFVEAESHGGISLKE